MLGSDDPSITPYTIRMSNWERNFNHSVPFNENRFMIKLNGALMIVSQENIHIHTIFFCFLSFIGCILLLKVFQVFLDDNKKRWVVLTLAFPSFLFWTSGGLKESVIILAIGLLVYGFLFLREHRFASVLWVLMGIGLLLFTKYFLFLCLVPSLLAYYLWVSRIDLKTNALKYMGALVVLALILIALAPIDKRLDFARIISKKQKHAVAEALYMNAGSYSTVPTVEPNIASVAAGLPVGLCNTLFKPYLWQVRNPMMLMSALENIVLLLLVVLALLYGEEKAKINYNLLFFFLMAVLLYFALIGLMTPVIGNLVRYRVVMEPFLIFILVSIIDVTALKNLLRLKKPTAVFQNPA
jgi:hypothetical protein